MADRRLGRAERLAERARSLSVDGDHAAARDLHEQAVALCREVYAEQQAEAAEGIGDPDEHLRAAHALADHLGRLGGSLRRAGDLEEALKAYRDGAELEREWRLDDTYNRTNMITLWVELRPGEMNEILPMVEDTLRLVRRQARGPRREQWWAWADYGLLSVLSGESDDADFAYQRYLACDPRPVDIRSTRDILIRLRPAIAPFAPDVAQGLANASDQLAAEES